MRYTLGGDNLVLVTATQDWRLLGQQLVAEAASDFCQKRLALGRHGGPARMSADISVELRRKLRIPASLFPFVPKSCSGFVLICLLNTILCL